MLARKHQAASREIFALPLKAVLLWHLAATRGIRHPCYSQGIEKQQGILLTKQLLF